LSTIVESISILYYNLSTAFLATSLFFSKS